MQFSPISDNPLVSVMMPARNASEHLAMTLASIQSQTHKNWELVFVDDGSTDDTLDIARRAAKEDSRISVHTIEHGGRGMARNECLKYMHGELIAICDADDVSVPNRFEIQIAYLRSSPDIGAVGSAWIPFSTTTPPRDGPARLDANTSSEIKRAFDTGKMRLHNATVMMRMDLIKQFDGYRPELKRAQDYEFFSRLSRAGIRYYAIKEALLFYRQTSHLHSARYFVESNMYIRYADVLSSENYGSFDEFTRSLSGTRWNIYYRVKYIYYSIKMTVAHMLRR